MTNPALCRWAGFTLLFLGTAAAAIVSVVSRSTVLQSRARCAPATMASNVRLGRRITPASRAGTESKLLIRLPFSSVPLGVVTVGAAVYFRPARHRPRLHGGHPGEHPGGHLKHSLCCVHIRSANTRSVSRRRIRGAWNTQGRTPASQRSRRRSGETHRARHSAQCHCSCRALRQMNGVMLIVPVRSQVGHLAPTTGSPPPFVAPKRCNLWDSGGSNGPDIPDLSGM